MRNSEVILIFINKIAVFQYIALQYVTNNDLVNNNV